MTVWQWGPLRVPVCGGAYLRILPFRFVRACLRRIDKARPLVVYVHPWEVFQHTPRLALPALSRLVTYHNLGQMKSRLTALLDEFRFASMKRVLEATGVWDR
jgi:hypothetical protein